MADLEHPKSVYEHLDEVQLIDCREQVEWDAGRIEGAIFLPLNSILAGAGGDLDTTKPVVVVCRMGNRSGVATEMFRARGFDAHNLEGGMEAWEAEGLPFTAPDGSPGRVA